MVCSRSEGEDGERQVAFFFFFVSFFTFYFSLLEIIVNLVLVAEAELERVNDGSAQSSGDRSKDGLEGGKRRR